jgi:16S rRNA (guanine966-N2)-methyltransferase
LRDRDGGGGAAYVIRVTGGSLRGRVLRAPVPDGVRPTSGRVREAVFSMIGQDLRGWSMLDAFGGTGLMAIEAASRGAAPVWVVDRDRGALAAIRQNVAGTPVEVIVGDAARARLPEADLVWLDPPYADDIADWLRRFAPRARRLLVAEARAGVAWPELEGWSLDADRSYGDTAVALFVRVGAQPGVAEADVVGEDPGVVEAERR